RILISVVVALENLPQSFFLTGIELSNRDPVGGGGFADIYLRTWLGQTVAMKCTRIFYGWGITRKRQPIQLFFPALFTEVLVWKHLSSPYVLPCLGVSDLFPDLLTIVSPWMKHGNVLQYLQKMELLLEEVDRLLEKIAEGLEYLHGEGIVYGDLRARSSILIDDELNPRLTGFGLAVTEESQEETEPVGSLRWMAPELIFQPKGLEFRRTRASDVYPYGYVCLEVRRLFLDSIAPFRPSQLYTGAPPFPKIWIEPEVATRVMSGHRPKRPTQAECKGRIMNSELWELITRCWSQEPESRPDMGEVVAQMKRIVG
ncbi:hypothetical protein JAAARDRAFT_127753, partial [Jaapia argillacea MUCL 33604]